MKLALFLFALFGLALAEREKCADIVPMDGTVPYVGEPGYVIDYEVAKSGVDAMLHLDITNAFDGDSLPTGTQLVVKVDRKGATAASVDIGAYFSGITDFTGVASTESGVTWSTATYTVPTTIPSEKVYVKLHVSCAACSKTAEFNVHTWVKRSGVLIPITLIAEKRSSTFEISKGGVVTFTHNFTNPTDVYFDLTAASTETLSVISAEYYDLDSMTVKDIYPNKTIKGSWLQEEPFEVDGLGQFIFTVVNNTLGDVDFSVKAGFNKLPCSSAFGLVSNMFLLALIPFTLFLNKF